MGALALPLGGQSIWQVYKRCYDNEKTGCYVIHKGEMPALIEYASLVCESSVRLAAATIGVGKTGAIQGTHGIPLSNVPSQAAGSVRLIARPGFLIAANWQETGTATGKKWCEFTATLTPLK